MKYFASRLMGIIIVFGVQVIGVSAAEPCGNIYPLYTENPVPITDCDDPFGVTPGSGLAVELTINGEAVENEAVIAVPVGGTRDIEVTYTPAFSDATHTFYLHQGDNYVELDLRAFEEPTEARLMELAEAFFDTNSEAAFFVDAYLNGSDHLTEAQEDMLFDFEDYVDENLETAPVRAGTYTMVTRDFCLILGRESVWEHIRSYFIPPVFACGPTDLYVYTRTFELIEEEPEPEPTGASNILFLPGIQASRLYTDGVLGTENQLWEPNRNADVEKLEMTEDGQSVNDVYTRDIMDEVFGVDNIYQGFMDFMDELVEEDTIAAWEPFAYDWRYDVFDIVSNGTRSGEENEVKTLLPLDVLNQLTSTSKSGKVTIIAHSNGGLLAKAIMHTLGESGGDIVDTIIFIGTPHLGTPKAIGTVLHGYDQQKVGGAIINDSTARTVMKNMAGVYSLLPSAAYLATTSQPLVTFDDSNTTLDFRIQYGSEISSFEKFTEFLNGAEDVSGRNTVLPDEVHKPTVANSDMLATAQAHHAETLDVWEPPEGVKVYNIVGTGLPTMKAIEYREIVEYEQCIEINNQITCTPVTGLKPYALMTKYGDETVVSVSARFSNNDYYLDLDAIDSSLLYRDREHADITGSPQVLKLVNDIIHGTSSEIAFISKSEPKFADKYDIETIDSPVHISAEDTEGNITGVVIEDGEESIKEEIPGSHYFEFGGTKYLIIPSGVTRTTTLIGEAHGGYTLTIGTLNEEDNHTTLHAIENATVTPTMQATYTKNEAGYGLVTTDLDGDGEIDITSTINGEVIPDEQVTYETLIAVIESLELSPRKERILLRVTKLAQKFDKKKRTQRLEKRVLKLLDRFVDRYERRGYITAEQRDGVVDIINILK